MKPICVRCQRFYRMVKSGYYFTEGMPTNGRERPKPGTAAPEDWKPYKIWAGDLWECHGCHSQLISGTGMSPIAIHHQSGFQEHIKALGADQFQVNDC